MAGADSISLKKIVDIFYEKVVADPKIGHFFGNIDLIKLKRHQVSKSNTKLASLLRILATWQQHMLAAQLALQAACIVGFNCIACSMKGTS